MQSPVVMAFRKRLKKRGYFDIHIKIHEKEKDTYTVSVKEPFSDTYLTAVYSSAKMYYSFK